MQNLLLLSILGSILTLLLIFLKPYLIKQCGGSWYYYIWAFVLFSLCVPYKIDVFQYFKVPQANVSENNTLTALSPSLLLTNESIENSEMAPEYFSEKYRLFSFFTLKNCLLYLYLFGLILFVLFYMNAYLIFRKNIRNRSILVKHAETLAIWTNTLHRMNIQKSITLIQGDVTSIPMIIGVLNPIVILPTKKFTDIELSMIFTHELTHYKRKDLIYKLIAFSINCIHWFNPIIYLATKTINEACEYSCDEYVTRKMDSYSRREYGHLILSQAMINKNNTLLLTGLAGENKNILKRRMNVIMNDKKYKKVLASLLTLVIILLSTNCFAFKEINPLNQTIAPIATTPKAVAAPSIKPSKPVTLNEEQKKVIVIDPGHGGKDPGGASVDNTLLEKNITLDIAKRVQKLIKAEDLFEVQLTRESDTTIKLEDRVAIGNKDGDIFISLHVNIAGDTTLKGIETSCYKSPNEEKNKNSLALEKNLRSSLTDSLQMKDLGVKGNQNFYVLKNSDVTAVLLDLGFITNPEDKAKLQKEEYLQKAAEAIYKGLKDYSPSS